MFFNVENIILFALKDYVKDYLTYDYNLDLEFVQFLSAH